MPQPLSMVKKDAEIFTEATELPPELCVQIVRTISAWSHIDQIIASMLAGFLEADFAVAAAMFRALSSDEAKRAAVIGAAKEARPDKRDIVQAVLNATKTYRGIRHKFAHHIWATSPDVPKAMILIDPKAIIESDFALHEKARRGELHPKATKEGDVIRLDFPQFPTPDRSKMMVYKLKELQDIANDAFACVHTYKLLNRVCGKFPDDEAQQELLSVPPIQQEFEHLTSENGQSK